MSLFVHHPLHAIRTAHGPHRRHNISKYEQSRSGEQPWPGNKKKRCVNNNSPKPFSISGSNSNNSSNMYCYNNNSNNKRWPLLPPLFAANKTNLIGINSTLHDQLSRRLSSARAQLLQIHTVAHAQHRAGNRRHYQH